MKKTTKAAAFAALLCLSTGAVSAGAASAQSVPSSENDTPVSRGEYVSRLGDCVACHTALHGTAFSGGLKINTPVGAIYSTNITPDKETGIGNYTLADFTRALREGIRKDGSTMYPAMPYPSFARMSDADIAALYEYFMHGVKPVHAPNRAVEIPWPMSMRWPLSIWRAMYAPSPKPMNTQEGSDSVERGEYLVTGPGHCGSCHTPRGIGMQEKAMDGSGGPVYLSGGAPIDNWIAPSLRDDPIQGIGKWSEDDIFLFLKTGRIDHSAVFGGMADVVGWSTQHWTDSDLRATAKYLKSLPTVPVEQRPAKDASATTQLLQSGNTASNAGADIYLKQCAICHRSDGGGVNRMFPPLDGNPVVVSDNPTSLVNVVTYGGILPPTNWAPSAVAMPGYHRVLNDQQIADVVNFIRNGWSNQSKGTVSAADVQKLRTTGAPVSSAGWNTSSQGWMAYVPQPYGAGWTFSPETHSGVDENQ
ncbi:c-type cytochrome [Kozakia baliensis]|uniref:c-type cytochrome n=1 Tax=Kozakia baliensis TaxID=153496 RepID=UPI00087C455E|nr:cytochrome c [Kozakia baliensis]AOX18951.1 alcohol dehydrogenase [Kozakia baliensis]